MKTPLLLTLLLLATGLTLQAQVGINADGSQPDPRTMLDVKSTSKGVLLPRLTEAQRNALNLDVPDGMMIFNITANELQIFMGDMWYPISMGTGIEVPLTDNDGNSYTTVVIGTQVWMAQNLRTTKYNDGTSIQKVENEIAWANLSTPGFCWYNNDSATYSDPYGALYNWYAVNTGKLCPTGWHVPTDAEWYTLENFVDPTINNPEAWDFRGTDGGTKLKSTTGWNANNGTDDYGFNGLPAGYRWYDSGNFSPMGNDCDLWCSHVGSGYNIYRSILTSATIGRIQNHERWGLYVRCIKDE